MVAFWGGTFLIFGREGVSVYLRGTPPPAKHLPSLKFTARLSKNMLPGPNQDSFFFRPNTTSSADKLAVKLPGWCQNFLNFASRRSLFQPVPMERIEVLQAVWNVRSHGQLGSIGISVFFVGPLGKPPEVL